MTKKIQRTILLILFIFVLTACNGSEEATVVPTAVAEADTPTATVTIEPTATNTAVPTETPTPLPTDTPEPTNTPEPTLEPSPTPANCPELDLQAAFDAFTTFQSYRTKLDFKNPFGLPLMHMNIAYNIEDQAIEILLDQAGEVAITMIAIGDKIYFREGLPHYQGFTDEWSAIEGVTAETMVARMMESRLFTPEFATQLTMPVCIAEETLHNINTYHYRFSNVDLSSFPELSESLAAEGVLTNLIVDVWIATEEDGGYLTEANMSLELDDDDIYDLHMKVSNINSPIQIKVPENIITTPSISETIPIIENAEILLESEGLFLYSTTDSVEEVLAFYEAEFANLGWVFDSHEIVIQEGIEIPLYTYHLDDRTLTLAIFDAQDGRTLVSLALENTNP